MFIQIFAKMIKFSYLIKIGFLSLFLLGLKIFLDGNFRYWFFAWNLFLAILPLIFILCASLLKQTQKNFWFITLFILLWFIFFPNSHYILTDMVHIRPNNFTQSPYWFDVVFFTNFAILGVLLAFESLKVFLDNFVKVKWRLATSFLLWLISCFGIYIGREWRLNSWDILYLPSSILNQNIELKDIIPFITVWPISLCLWFWLWYRPLKSE